jgi:hypothetical protein
MKRARAPVFALGAALRAHWITFALRAPVFALGAAMRAHAVARVAVLSFAVAFSASPASAQPDPNKVLRVAFPAAETGFDPQAAGDEYSNNVNRVIFDTLYKYDYLARPYKLVPNTAVGMPEISADGKTWKIRIKPGIYFTDDPGVQGAAPRADRRRLRLRIEARARSEDALQFAAIARRPVRRSRAGHREGEGDGQARL